MNSIISKKLNVNQVKSRNKELVLQSLIDKGKMTRTQIAQTVSLSNATVGTIIDELLDLDILLEIKDDSVSIGRKPSIVSVNDSKVLAMVIDLSSRHTLSYNVMNIKNEVVFSGAIAVSEDKKYDQQFKDFLLNVHDEIAKKGIEHNLIGICLSVSGIYDRERDVVISQTVAGLGSVNIYKAANELWNIDVLIDNDINLTTRSYFSGNSNLYSKNMIIVFLGDGIGSTIVIDGKIHEGANGFAGEIGQMQISEDKTLEQAVSWINWTESIKKAYKLNDNIDIESFISEKFAQRDNLLMSELDSAIDTFSSCFINIAWIINPSVIHLCGGYSCFG